MGTNEYHMCKVNAATYDKELSKQQQLKNNISIVGIPKREDEDVMETILEFFNSLDVHITRNDISAAYRTTGRTSTCPIIVKFVDFKSKLTALEAKATKPKETHNNGDNDQQIQPIYINNHVTPFFARLLAAGRFAVKDKLIHSCWIATEGCMIKVKEGDSSKNIKSLAELEAITGRNGLPKANKRSKPDNVSPQASINSNNNKYAKHN